MGLPTHEALRAQLASEDDAELARVAVSDDYSETARDVARELLAERGQPVAERPTPKPARSAPASAEPRGPEPPAQRALRLVAAVGLAGGAAYQAFRYLTMTSQLVSIAPDGTETAHVRYLFLDGDYGWYEHALWVGTIGMLLALAALFARPRSRLAFHAPPLFFLVYGAGLIGAAMVYDRPNPLPGAAFSLFAPLLWYLFMPYAVRRVNRLR